MSKAGPSLLRSAFVRAAGGARKQDPQLARIYYLQMTGCGAGHLKACCVVAGHLAERAWTTMNRGTPYVICDNDGNPVTPAEARKIITEKRAVTGEVRKRRRSKAGPSGRDRAGQARRPSPPTIVAAPRPGHQARDLTAATTTPPPGGCPPGGHPACPDTARGLSSPAGPGVPGGGARRRSCRMPGHRGAGRHVAGTPGSSTPAGGQRRGWHAAAAARIPRTPASGYRNAPTSRGCRTPHTPGI
jgi:hypothetical protein